MIDKLNGLMKLNFKIILMTVLVFNALKEEQIH
jgi:hypothetical protein